MILLMIGHKNVPLSQVREHFETLIFCDIPRVEWRFGDFEGLNQVKKCSLVRYRKKKKHYFLYEVVYIDG